MQCSKTVRHGDLLAKRGDKYVRASWNSRIRGSYHMGTRLTMLTEAGMETITIPKGVVLSGLIGVRVKGVDQ